MVLKLSKKVHFFQFCADLSRKSKTIKVIYIYASEKVLLHTFRKWYCLLCWLRFSEILGFEVEESAIFLLSQHLFLTNDPLFIYFFHSVCNIPSCIKKWLKFIFMWHSLRSILVCEILQFWAHTFLESRHTEVTKNPYYVLSPDGSQKRYQLMD